MDVISMQNYLNYSAQMNKDAIYNNLRQTTVHNDEVSANQDKEEAIKKVEENEKVQNEEVVALYFNHEATQAMKSRVETLFDESSNEQEESLTFDEVRDLQKRLNQYESIQNIDEKYRVLLDNRTETWA